jgi:hypothetical protein
MEVCHLSFCVWRNKWKLLSHPPQTSLEKLFAYIQACGNRSSKTLCLIGIRRKSCDVWCFLTRYEVGAMVTTLGSKYLEYYTFPELKYRTIIEQIIERHLYSEMHNKWYMSTVLKRHSGGSLLQAKRDCSNQVHSDQMVLGTVRQEAGPRKRRPKALKSKLTQGGRSGSSPLKSEASHDGQAKCWTLWEAPKDAQERVGKQL